MIPDFWGQLQPVLYSLWPRRWFRVCFYLFMLVAFSRAVEAIATAIYH